MVDSNEFAKKESSADDATEDGSSREEVETQFTKKNNTSWQLDTNNHDLNSTSSMVGVEDVMGAALILRAKQEGQHVPTHMADAARRVEASINSTQLTDILNHMASRAAFQSSSAAGNEKDVAETERGREGEDAIESVVNTKYQLIDIGLDGVEMASFHEICENVVVEAKAIMNRLPEFIFLAVGIAYAFVGTFYASQRHETAHDFCARTGVYDGQNDAAVLPFGTDLDQYRARDLGFDFIPEVHSKAIETVEENINLILFFKFN